MEPKASPKDELGTNDLGNLGPMGSLGTLFYFGKRDNEDTLQQIDDMLAIDQFVQVSAHQINRFMRSCSTHAQSVCYESIIHSTTVRSPHNRNHPPGNASLTTRRR
eukprot:SAG31_NODE_6911_length_1853_cov_2.270810_1_plen_106_part_00